jgi:gamma-glutamyl-gamma-aminobutyrate hydrolase PuuD
MREDAREIGRRERVNAVQHSFDCLCTECEVHREQSSHDAEINRIADALGMDTESETPTIEAIVAEIKLLKKDRWL